MRVSGALVAALSCTSIATGARAEAPRQEAPAKVRAEGTLDMSDLRSQLKVLEDGKGHYLVLGMPIENGTSSSSYTVDREGSAGSRTLFYGDGKTFYELPLIMTSYDTTSGQLAHLELAFWEPRANRGTASLVLDGGQFMVQCEERKTQFFVSPPTKSAALLDDALFRAPLWTRTAYALARDKRGNYYYVDRLRGRDAKGFRLFAGPRGNMKLLAMRNVVSDSEGDIFSTRTGELRLVLDKKEALWVKGKKESPLTVVPPERNVFLIYAELGVYATQPLGTPCDDI